MDPRLQKHPLGYFEIVNKPTTEELQEYYSDKYYQEAKSSYEHEYSEDELTYFQVKLEQRFAALQKAQPNLRCGGQFLDVGCGEGYALAFFRNKGYETKGLDFSSAGIESKNPNCVDVLETGNVFELLKEEITSGNVYDVVWLQNVLEHVLDPISLLKSLRKLVSSNGVVVITVPNDCSIVQREALERNYIDHAFWIAPPDHLSYFDYNSMKNIAGETDWYCADIYGDFPVDLFLLHPESNYVRNKLLGKDAHRSAVQIENLISKKPIEQVLDFWRSVAQVGIGRNLTSFFIPKV
ncbi:MAG: class I SAM-dependent methyltransferase [Proteobacteria bacterium]|nr:class I SAM-dependent methyltransferase [Pseudomonadota bacterium]NOG59084.1 class I SAM-dependent methyltransferase [Pseudomonadota bacterium]